jgi:hypothetical protein
MPTKRLLAALACWAAMLPACHSTLPVARTAPERSLHELLDRHLTRPVAVAPTLAERLRAARVAPPQPGSEVVAWAAAELDERGMGLVPLGAPEVHAYLVETSETARFLREYARFVPYSDIEQYRNRFVLITTLVPMRFRPRWERAVHYCFQPPPPLAVAPTLEAFVVTDFGPIVCRLVELGPEH